MASPYTLTPLFSPSLAFGPHRCYPQAQKVAVAAAAANAPHGSPPYVPLTPSQSQALTGALSGLSRLRHLDVYDTGGHMRLTQQLLEDLASWFPQLRDFYFEGCISVAALGGCGGAGGARAWHAGGTHRPSLQTCSWPSQRLRLHACSQ